MNLKNTAVMGRDLQRALQSDKAPSISMYAAKTLTLFFNFARVAQCAAL
jgi:hypothetical protein